MTTKNVRSSKILFRVIQRGGDIVLLLQLSTLLIVGEYLQFSQALVYLSHLDLAQYKMMILKILDIALACPKLLIDGFHQLYMTTIYLHM